MHISILFSFLRNDTEITGLALQTLCNLLSADLQGKRRISILTELPYIKFCLKCTNFLFTLPLVPLHMKNTVPFTLQIIAYTTSQGGLFTCISLNSLNTCRYYRWCIVQVRVERLPMAF